MGQRLSRRDPRRIAFDALKTLHNDEFVLVFTADETIHYLRRDVEAGDGWLVYNDRRHEKTHATNRDVRNFLIRFGPDAIQAVAIHVPDDLRPTILYWTEYVQQHPDMYPELFEDEDSGGGGDDDDESETSPWARPTAGVSPSVAVGEAAPAA